MQSKRGELVPIGEVVSGLDDAPVPAIRDASPQAQHHFTQADQVDRLVRASEADPDRGFLGRTMALCCLPRTNPGNRLQYERRNGPFTLYMIAGGGNKLPFGTNPRLILAWICTEAVRTQSRELVLGRSLSAFMRKLGIASTDGRRLARLRNQMDRLFGCSVSMIYEDEHGKQFVNSHIANRGEFWWNKSKPDQAPLWGQVKVTGERIRDKIAASKRKGMWMGGNPPLGYDVKDKKLIVNKAETETVRSIFRQYREIESVRELRDRLAAEGVTSKRRVRRDGSIVGGKPINRGALYHLLHNRLYRGEMVHKDKAYPGQHEAIVDEALWDEVQATLAANTNGERREGTRQPSLLTGLVVDEQGEGLSPSHAVKKGRRYRYYVSRHLITEGKRAGRKGWRLPAADLEGLVVVRLREWLNEPAAISAVIDGDPQEASAHASLITQAQSLADRWPELKPHQAKAYLNALLRRVIVESARIVIEIDGERALATLLAGPDVVSIKRSRQDVQPAKHPIILDIPIALERAGTGMKLVVPGARNNAKCAPGLIRLLLRAFAIRDRLGQNPDLTLKRI